MQIKNLTALVSRDSTKMVSEEKTQDPLQKSARVKRGHRVLASLAMSVVLIFFGGGVAFWGEQPRGQAKRSQKQYSNLIAPGLMQIGLETNFFLGISNQIGMSKKQRKAIEEIAFRFQSLKFRMVTNLYLKEAELWQLLTQDFIDLEAVESKLKESEAVSTQVKKHQVECLLEAAGVLTPEQQVRALTLEPGLPPVKQPTPLERIRNPARRQAAGKLVLKRESHSGMQSAGPSGRQHPTGQIIAGAVPNSAFHHSLRGRSGQQEYSHCATFTFVQSGVSASCWNSFSVGERRVGLPRKWPSARNKHHQNYPNTSSASIISYPDVRSPKL
ncbi:MAG: hypothetical protein AB1898_11245 [Acidobacteriota bacterium]